MITTVNKSAFSDAFRDHNRTDNFSYTGLGSLFDYLEDLEEGSDTPIELDVIALCCDYSEYTLMDVMNYYDIPGTDLGVDADQEANLEAVREYLEDNTSVVRCDAECILFACF
jgi:hypothetical protein